MAMKTCKMCLHGTTMKFSFGMRKKEKKTDRPEDDGNSSEVDNFITGDVTATDIQYRKDDDTDQWFNEGYSTVENEGKNPRVGETEHLPQTQVRLLCLRFMIFSNVIISIDRPLFYSVFAQNLATSERSHNAGRARDTHWSAFNSATHWQHWSLLSSACFSHWQSGINSSTLSHHWYTSITAYYYQPRCRIIGYHS